MVSGVWFVVWGLCGEVEGERRKKPLEMPSRPAAMEEEKDKGPPEPRRRNLLVDLILEKKKGRGRKRAVSKHAPVRKLNMHISSLPS